MQSASEFWGHLTAPKRPEPSYPVLPVVDAASETNIPGVYALGELAGVPLVRMGLNAGCLLYTSPSPRD